MCWTLEIRYASLGLRIMSRLESEGVLMEWDVISESLTSCIPHPTTIFDPISPSRCGEHFHSDPPLVKPSLLQQTAIFQLMGNNLCSLENGILSQTNTKAILSAYEVKNKWSLFGGPLEQKKNGVFVFWNIASHSPEIFKFLLKDWWRHQWF